MRAPCVRLRTLMIAVAVVGTLFGLLVALERQWQRDQYTESLRKAAEQEQLARELVEALTRRIPEDPDHFKYWSAYYAQEADHHARHKRNIQRAMDRRWWEPDPEYEREW